MSVSLTLAFLASVRDDAASGPASRARSISRSISGGDPASDAVSDATSNALSRRILPDEAALVARIVAHDVSAFDQVYLAYFGGLVAFVGRIVGSPDVACDVVQDTFLALWNGDASRVTTSLRAYLFGAARFRALHVVRREGVERRAALRPEVRDPTAWHGQTEVAPDVAAEHAALHAEVVALIASLTVRQREAAELRWVDGLTATEIGAVMAISEAAARKLLKHAEVRLEGLRARWGSAPGGSAPRGSTPEGDRAL